MVGTDSDEERRSADDAGPDLELKGGLPLPATTDSSLLLARFTTLRCNGLCPATAWLLLGRILHVSFLRFNRGLDISPGHCLASRFLLLGGLLYHQSLNLDFLITNGETDFLEEYPAVSDFAYI